MNQNPSHEYAEQQPYLTDGRRTPGPPPEPYMGGYSVSNAAAEYHQGGVQSHNAPYYVPQIANHGLLDTPMHMGDPRVVAGAASAGASLPSQHTNPAYHHGHREGEAASPFSRTVEPRGDVGSPKRRATQAPNRVQKAQSNSARRKASTSRGTGQTFDPSEDNKNCLNQEVPPTLRDDCTGEELALFQLRWEHRDKKGDSMWDLIRSGLTERFDKPYEKEQVQMKYKRARSKYIVWLSEDVSNPLPPLFCCSLASNHVLTYASQEKLLEEAWREVEKSRYQLILDKFLELGGSRNMNASPSDIEAKLVVSHKFEKDIYIEDLQDIPVRRRRQPNPRNRRANGGRTDNEDNRLQGLQDQTIDEDEVIDQIHGRRGSRAMLSPEMMDMQTTDGQRFRTEPGVHHHHAGHGYAQQNGPRSPPNHGEYNQRRRV